MRRIPTLSVLGAWVATVSLASATIWLVVASAGNQVGSTSVAMSTMRPSASATPTATATASATATTTAPTLGAPTPTPNASDASPIQPSRSAGSPSSAAVTRTWSGGPGIVTATCHGTTVTLQAVPNSGYQVELHPASNGPGSVEFEGPAGEVYVQASCADGTPTFQVERG